MMLHRWAHIDSRYLNRTLSSLPRICPTMTIAKRSATRSTTARRMQRRVSTDLKNYISTKKRQTKTSRFMLKVHLLDTKILQEPRKRRLVEKSPMNIVGRSNAYFSSLTLPVPVYSCSTAQHSFCTSSIYLVAGRHIHLFLRVMHVGSVCCSSFFLANTTMLRLRNKSKLLVTILALDICIAECNGFDLPRGDGVSRWNDDYLCDHKVDNHALLCSRGRMVSKAVCSAKSPRLQVSV